MYRHGLPAFVLAALLAGGAEAGEYCWIQSEGSVLVDGGTVTNAVKIVVASVPRPEVPGLSTDRPWCTQYRRSIGGHGENKLIVSPKLGTVRFSAYAISYKGDRVGHDRFVVERTWVGVRNEKYKGTLVYDVDVLAAPF